MKFSAEQYNDGEFHIYDQYTDTILSKKGQAVRGYSFCPVKEFSCVVGADASVYYCHDKAYESDGFLFSLKEISLKEGWGSQETETKFKAFDAKKGCPYHCAYDDRNQLLNLYLERDKRFENFI